MARLALGFGMALLACLSSAQAETLQSALARAYLNNPSLNSQRASVRATDEDVPQALSGYRPKVTITATGGEQSLSTTSKSVSTLTGPLWSTLSGYNSPFSTGITATQTLFNGFLTANKTRQAEAKVLSARATLAKTVQTVLLNAVTAYMDVLRDKAILDLDKRNVEVLQEQLRQTTDRFNVGEVTRTDVAQSESSLGGRPLGGAHGAGELHGLRRHLSPDHRHSARKPRARYAGRPPLAAHTSCGHRSGAGHQSLGDQRAVRCRFGARGGEGGGERARPDLVGAGQLHQELAEHAEFSTPCKAMPRRSSAR